MYAYIYVCVCLKRKVCFSGLNLDFGIMCFAVAQEMNVKQRKLDSWCRPRLDVESFGFGKKKAEHFCDHGTSRTSTMDGRQW